MTSIMARQSVFPLIVICKLLTQRTQIFLVCFLSAELPSGLISKKLGADRWIPFLICSWSLVSGSQAALQSRSAYFAIKALLGLLMGGFIP
jgi:hypothetical protein